MSAAPRPRRRVLDWRFLVALMVAAMVAYLIFSGMAAIRESQLKGARIDRLIAQVDQQRREADAAREKARQERGALLEQLQTVQRNQARILAKLPPERPS